MPDVLEQVKGSFDRKHTLAILLVSWFCSIVWSHVHRAQIGKKKITKARKQFCEK